jgi:aminoglycoside phosphotransferase (APT) family kinase protein
VTFAQDIADLILALRSAETGGLPFNGNGRGSCLTDHDEWMSVCFSKSEGLLDVPRLRNLWSKLRELPAIGNPEMSHKDLIPANLLVQNGRLAGVIDSGSFGPHCKKFF